MKSFVKAVEGIRREFTSDEATQLSKARLEEIKNGKQDDQKRMEEELKKYGYESRRD